MTIQIITSKEINSRSTDEVSAYLDGSILDYLQRNNWIIDNISII